MAQFFLQVLEPRAVSYDVFLDIPLEVVYPGDATFEQGVQNNFLTM